MKHNLENKLFKACDYNKKKILCRQNTTYFSKVLQIAVVTVGLICHHAVKEKEQHTSDFQWFVPRTVIFYHSAKKPLILSPVSFVFCSLPHRMWMDENPARFYSTSPWGELEPRHLSCSLLQKSLTTMWRVAGHFCSRNICNWFYTLWQKSSMMLIFMAHC